MTTLTFMFQRRAALLTRWLGSFSFNQILNNDWYDLGRILECLPVRQTLNYGS